MPYFFLSICTIFALFLFLFLHFGGVLLKIQSRLLFIKDEKL